VNGTCETKGKSQGSLAEGGRFSTVDLLVLTSLGQLLFIFKISFTFFYKTSYLVEEVNRTEPSLSVSVSCQNLLGLCYAWAHYFYRSLNEGKSYLHFQVVFLHILDMKNGSRDLHYATFRGVINYCKVVLTSLQATYTLPWSAITNGREH